MSGILWDISPARVETGTQTYGNSRVIVSGDTVLLYTTRSGRVLLTRRSKVLERDPPRSAGDRWGLTLQSGEIWTITQESKKGCGCRSPLGRAPIEYDLQSEEEV